jgi:hypothetical protein
MNNNRIIQLPEPDNKKEIKTKEKCKRIIVEDPIWNFTENELEYQTIFLEDPPKLLIQQIKKKLTSYKSQDLEKDIYDPIHFIDLSNTLQKLNSCSLKCFYCDIQVLLMYEYVREPKQWTLERLNNNYGHTTENTVIACLSCNLRRRTMHFDRYLQTKQMTNIIKKDNHL